jgi:phenylacetate-CoA ligase
MMKHPTQLSLAVDVWRASRGGKASMALRRHQRLLDLVEFARTHSPFYQQHYRQLQAEIPESTFREQLPPVTKPDLMAHFDDWVTDPAITRAGVEAFVADKTLIGAPYLGRYFVCITSGTTGIPGLFIQDLDALKVQWATSLVRGYRTWMTPRMSLAMLRAGSRMAMLVATKDHFQGIGLLERFRKRYPWLTSYFRQVQVLDVTQPLEAIVQALNAFQPARLMGYPTMLDLLAGEQVAGRLHIKPVIAIGSGEWLGEASREHITSAFGCPVHSAYAASECQSIGWDCEQGWLHVNADWVILEAVDEAYRPIPAGQPSHTVLLTNLANYVQPIIRYDLGDSITVKPDPCPCGNPLPAIHVEGRTDEILYLETREGQTIPLLPMGIATVVEQTPGVRRFQAIQTGPSALQIRLEAMPEADEMQVWAMVSQRLQEYLRAQSVPFVHLEKAAEHPSPHPISGKFRHVWAEQTSPEKHTRVI